MGKMEERTEESSLTLPVGKNARGYSLGFCCFEVVYRLGIIRGSERNKVLLSSANEPLPYTLTVGVVRRIVARTERQGLCRRSPSTEVA